MMMLLRKKGHTNRTFAWFHDRVTFLYMFLVLYVCRSWISKRRPFGWQPDAEPSGDAETDRCLRYDIMAATHRQ